jgi:predicted transcriptional regulator of viral defense system
VPGAVYTEIFDVAVDQYGYVRTEDLRELGIDIKRLGDLKARGLATHVAAGLYRLNAVPATRYDQYMEAVLWHRGLGVLSHETALDFYDVCDINPAKIHITVPKQPRVTRTPPPLYRLYRENLDPRTVTRREGIPIVTLETAIRQCAQIHVSRHLLKQAIENGRRGGQLRAEPAATLRAQLNLPADA